MAGKVQRWTPERRADVERALRSSETRHEAAKLLGVGVGALDHACYQYGIDRRALLGSGAAEPRPVLDPPPPPGLTAEELVGELKKRYARRSAHETAKKLIPVRVSSDEPFGLVGFGDLHLDDPGCNIAQVEADARVVRETPGMYGFTPGDLLNNWVGRLQKLYGQQTVTQAEGWQLVEWYLDQVEKWLFVVLGNHDVWTGPNTPFPWIMKNAGAFSQAHDVRVALRFPNGREVRIHCRHDFPGRSVYNDAHGPLRAALFGHRDHVKVCGHTHVSAYHLMPDTDTGIAMHFVRLSTYKEHDDYANEGGYLKRSLGPAVALVIDPKLEPTHPDLIKPFWDVAAGADYLSWARKRKRRAA